MNSIDDFPQRSNTHDIAEEAETALRNAIGSCSLFVIQREDRNDYGTDVQIEARSGNGMTNIRAHIQLKGTESPPNANGSISVSISRTNLNYLLSQTDSMYVCYHLPSKRLLVRYADDLFREYEHRGDNWNLQDSMTVNFKRPFDEEFQNSLNAHLLASGKSSRNRRLQWASSPPEKISVLVQQNTPHIEVPTDAKHALAILTELYKSNNDAAISNSFAQFNAVLGSIPGAMDFAYMAEINLGITGAPFDKERVKQGAKILEKALERGDVNPASVLYCQGNALLALEEYELARATYESALIQLDTPEASHIASQCCKNLGGVLEHLGEMKEARALFERSLELNPDSDEAHFALGLWHFKNDGDLGLALHHLDQVIGQRWSELQMAAVLGWKIDILFNMGDANRAFREINTLLPQANKLDWAWNWCAHLVAEFGWVSVDSVQKAIRFWRIYLKEYPQDTRANRELLLCQWQSRAFNLPTEIDYSNFKSEAIRLIENGDPDSAYLWDRVGHWAQFDQNWREAESAYRKAYELEPERYGYCLGTALNFLGRFDEALPILIFQAEEYLSNAQSWFQVAIAYEGIGETAATISAYHQALKLDGDYDLAWFNLGGVYWNSGDKKQAVEIWNKAITRYPNHELAQKLLRELPMFFRENQKHRQN